MSVSRIVSGHWIFHFSGIHGWLHNNYKEKVLVSKHRACFRDRTFRYK